MPIQNYSICDTCINSHVIRSDSGSIHLQCKNNGRYVNSFESCIDFEFDNTLLQDRTKKHINYKSLERSRIVQKQ